MELGQNYGSDCQKLIRTNKTNLSTAKNITDRPKVETSLLTLGVKYAIK